MNISFKNKQANHGYMVMDNFLDEKLANELRALFEKESDWKEINQVREGHYEHVFFSENALNPDPGEIYSANFWRSSSLENNISLNRIYHADIMPKLADITGNVFEGCDVRCYKLMVGDYYRSHCDDYAGDIGLILYLNKSWKYDWGGMLNISDGQEIKTIMPIFNRAVIIWHEIFKLHHSVSTIANYALEPRFTITSFNKISKE